MPIEAAFVKSMNQVLEDPAVDGSV